MLSLALLRQAGRQALASPLRNSPSPGPPLWTPLLKHAGFSSPLGSFGSPRTWSSLGRQDVTASLRKFSLARWSEEVRGRLGFRRSYGGGFGGYGGRGGAQTVVWGLVGVNLVVFGLWQTVDRRFMMENFMVSVDAVMRGRLHTIVTSAFSQARFDHLAMNMLGLYFFGSEIAQLFGGRWLLNLYLAGGIAGSVGHLLYCAFVIPWLENIPQHRFNARYTPSALGASGAVNAIVLLHILLFPTRIIMVNLFIPVPAALFGVYLIGSDVYQARNEGSRTAHAGHLGGALVGAMAWISLRRRRW
jgi:membrane associated rhomboid family serine protease